MTPADDEPVPSIDASPALAAVLDELVPPRPDGRLPGAGALGLAAEVTQGLAAQPERRAAIAAGLEALEAIAHERGVPGFAALDADARRTALTAAADASPAFLPTLAFLTYAAYYADPRVLEAIGHEPRPPFPEGYAMPESDLDARLARVCTRAPFYRTP